MNRRQLVVLVCVTLVLGLATVAFAGQGQRQRGMKGMHGGMQGGFGMGMHGRMLDQMATRLKLTPDQEQRVRQLARDRAKQSMSEAESSRAARHALMKEVFSEQPNQAEIQKQVAFLQQHSAKTINDFVSSGIEMNKVLTPEQRAEMQKMLDENQQVTERRRERMRQRMTRQPAPANK
ncbi:MAG TPA: periplasmic heavy metal sensor [Clostridia bacterium]|nr:periplasmic heavy metal sensor [Clostridia bacterium]